MKRVFAVLVAVAMLMSFAQAEGIGAVKPVFEAVYNEFRGRFRLPELPEGVITEKTFDYSMSDVYVGVKPDGAGGYENAIVAFSSRNTNAIYDWINCVSICITGTLPGQWMHTLYVSYLYTGEGSYLDTVGGYGYRIKDYDDGTVRFAVMKWGS